MSAPWPLSAVAHASSTPQCSHCGHPRHDGICPRTIQTDRKTQAPCPCVQHLKEKQ